MSDKDTTGFGKFVPGFDFLQSLAKGASSNIPQMPNLGNWVAPTLNAQELEKRIEELKAVHFWLEQNSRMLGATIQALEVQKMTLATLKGMNFNIGDMANAFKLNATESAQTSGLPGSDRATSTAKTDKTGKAAVGMGALVDPLHLWGSLTQQFQQIAAGAFKEVASQAAADATKNVATGIAKDAIRSAKAGKRVASGAVKRAAAKTGTRKAASRS